MDGDHELSLCFTGNANPDVVPRSSFRLWEAGALDPAFDAMGIERNLEMFECAQHIPVQRRADRHETAAVINGQRMAGNGLHAAYRICFASDQG
ncbi:hypothetical protein L485_03655 [Sphingobium baderi LL03]|uniref:Uncharacterized protein n=1 Tax=Sphingobium baderi LL03 TaxID=1114964 RepID=T0GVJ6_9SPHN|nr:hypothetical protein L485_03655 [Sphingobium baderi LL03]